MKKYKTCSGCGAVKPLAAFSKDSARKDGLQHECKDCQKQRKREWYERNKKRVVQTRRERYERNKEREKQKSREYREANKERVRQRMREYCKTNPDKYNMYNATRRAFKLRATPAWLTATHKAQIKAMYAKAIRLTAKTGINYHVDHIVPLKNSLVCGLHVPWNLQVITKTENIVKNNRLTEGINYGRINKKEK